MPNSDRSITILGKDSNRWFSDQSPRVLYQGLGHIYSFAEYHTHEDIVQSICDALFSDDPEECRFCSLSRPEHVSERSDPISEHYVSSLSAGVTSQEATPQ
jgi:hypothetical protein